MKLFNRCKHEWEVIKTLGMQDSYHDGYRDRKINDFTRIWYQCSKCQKTVTVDRTNHLSLEEVKKLYPRP